MSQSPPGFCNFQSIIWEGLSRSPEDGVSVELGVLYGQSTYYFDRFLKQHGRTKHQHYGVDQWYFKVPAELVGKNDSTDPTFTFKAEDDYITVYQHFMRTYAIPLEFHMTTSFIKSVSWKVHKESEDQLLPEKSPV